MNSYQSMENLILMEIFDICRDHTHIDINILADIMNCDNELIRNAISHGLTMGIIGNVDHNVFKILDSRYKTRKCMYYNDYGCNKGSYCVYIHGEEEERMRNMIGVPNLKYGRYYSKHSDKLSIEDDHLRQKLERYDEEIKRKNKIIQGHNEDIEYFKKKVKDLRQKNKLHRLLNRELKTMCQNNDRTIAGLNKEIRDRDIDIRRLKRSRDRRDDDCRIYNKKYRQMKQELDDTNSKYTHNLMKFITSSPK